MRILVVEDDPSVAQILKILLASHRYAVEIATDGEAGLSLAEAFEYDLILLDILLPKLDGISLCKTLRAKGYQMPILLLTGQGGNYEKVVGLDTGADDYVVKPFDQGELIARIRALLRRGHISSQPILEWDNLRLDPSSHEVFYGIHSLALTPKEYGLVEMFLRNPRLTFSLSMILEHLWTFEEAPSEDAVRVHMKTLRQKLKAAGAPIDLIETVYGVGYRLNPARAATPALSPDSALEPLELQPSAALSSAPPDLERSNMPMVMMITQDADLRSRLTALLESHKCRVAAIDPSLNLQEALQDILESHSPNLLILAAEPPQLKELECCQSIRQTDRWSALPIILITPHAEVDLVNRVFAVGANDFVSQPIAGPELLARALLHLEKAQLLQKIAVLEAHLSPLSLHSPAPIEKESDRPDWVHSAPDRSHFPSNTLSSAE
jgi:DNA-binding response OmpR family regulator